MGEQKERKTKARRPRKTEEATKGKRNNEFWGEYDFRIKEQTEKEKQKTKFPRISQKSELKKNTKKDEKKTEDEFEKYWKFRTAEKSPSKIQIVEFIRIQTSKNERQKSEEDDDQTEEKLWIESNEWYIVYRENEEGKTRSKEEAEEDGSETKAETEVELSETEKKIQETKETGSTVA